MRIAGWIPKATNTHSQYVILIAFPLQQWLHENASMLCYTYIACLVLPVLQFSPVSIIPPTPILIYLHLDTTSLIRWTSARSLGILRQSTALSESREHWIETVPRRFGLHHNIDKLLHSGECSDQSSGTERLGLEKIASYMYDSAVEHSGYYTYR
jgi:hypothetical protein